MIHSNHVNLSQVTKQCFKLGDAWVITLFRECVKFANVAPDAVEYATKLLKISLTPTKAW